MKEPIEFLRKTALVEGISYLVLLGIAMPLKYIWGQPQAVKVVGMLHGILFVIFCAALLYVMIVARWPLSRGALVFLASIIPFGPWLVDRRMHEYAREHRVRKQAG
jgi:integral membrane protein